MCLGDEMTQETPTMCPNQYSRADFPSLKKESCSTHHKWVFLSSFSDEVEKWRP